MRNPLRPFIAFAGAISTALVSAQPLDNSGTLFYLGFMQNYNGGTPQYLELSIASEFSTSGTVSSAAFGYNQPFTVIPFAVTSIIVPQTFMPSGSELVEDLGLKVESEDPITVQALNFEAYTADATAILPHPMLGTDHLVLAYQGLTGFTGLLSELLVVATAAGTEVEITPTANTVGGHIANAPFTVVLDEGQSYQVQAADAADDLTGSRVRVVDAPSPCTPIAVFSGAVCTDVPAGCFACDHLFEQDVPLTAWGTQFQTVPFEGASIYDLRLQAGADAAIVTVGTVPYAVAAGEHFDLPSQAGPLCISSDVPISVAQYMDGVTCSGYGDPAMVILGSEDQGITHATFSTITSTVITDHYFSLVTESANAGQISLNGVLIPAAAYTTYPICPDRVYYSSTISSGTWVLDAPLPFNATAYGMGSAESYAYSLGAVLPATIYTGDTVICWSGGTVTLTAPSDYVDPWWAPADAPEDTLAVDSQYTFVPVDGQQVMVSNADGSDPCFGTAMIYTIELLQPFTVTAMAALDSICAFLPVDLQAIASPLLPGMQFQWSPSTAVDDPTAAVTTATLIQDSWLTVTASSANGCNAAQDSVFIAVLAGSVMSVDASAADSAICLGNSTQLLASIGQAIGIDAFEGGLAPVWNSVTGGQPSNTCASPGDMALVFDGGPPRRATTEPLDVSNGGAIHFDLKISNGSSCDDAEPGDDVELQYSPNFGAVWYTMATFGESGYPFFTPIDLTMPAAAQTPNTMFRWQQVGTFAVGEDVWLLDNVVIEAITPAGMDIVWSPATGLSDPGIPDPFAAPSSSTTYTITVTDPLSGCSLSDTITIHVDSAFSVTAYGDTTVCYPSWMQLNAVASDSGSIYTWSETGSADCTLSNAYSPDAMVNCVPTTAMIMVTATSPIGCTATDTVLVQVFPQPALPVITQVGNTVFAPPGYAGYQWYLDGVAIPGAITDLTSVTASGVYTVVVSDANGCTNVSDPFNAIIDHIGGIVGSAFEVGYEAATGSLLLLSPLAIERVDVYSSIGQLIAHDEGTGRPGDPIRLAVAGQAIYLVQVTMGGRRYARRVPAF